MLLEIVVYCVSISFLPGVCNCIISGLFILTFFYFYRATKYLIRASNFKSATYSGANMVQKVA